MASEIGRPVRIAVMCPAEIARRRFMPALEALNERAEYAGVGVATAAEFQKGPEGSLTSGEYAEESCLVTGDLELAREMQKEWGGEVYHGYSALLADPSIDAIYLPLPPGLHAAWGVKVLESGKHLLMEKPFTVSLSDTVSVLSLAREQDLAVHENYMFAFHNQIAFARNLVTKGTIGAPRLYRVDFGFPFRGGNDFRYNRSLGGGALLDCGGYAVKLASMLAGSGACVEAAAMRGGRGTDVDVYGSATVQGSAATVQVAWGMDNDYRCSLDVWGSKGTLHTNRILTAPAGVATAFIISRNGEIEEAAGPADDSFAKSIAHFLDCIEDASTREARMEEIEAQAGLVERVHDLAGWAL